MNVFFSFGFFVLDFCSSLCSVGCIRYVWTYLFIMIRYTCVSEAKLSTSLKIFENIRKHICINRMHVKSLKLEHNTIWCCQPRGHLVYFVFPTALVSPLTPGVFSSCKLLILIYVSVTKVYNSVSHDFFSIFYKSNSDLYNELETKCFIICCVVSCGVLFCVQICHQVN